MEILAPRCSIVAPSLQFALLACVLVLMSMMGAAGSSCEKLIQRGPSYCTYVHGHGVVLMSFISFIDFELILERFSKWDCASWNISNCKVLGWQPCVGQLVCSLWRLNKSWVYMLLDWEQHPGECMCSIGVCLYSVCVKAILCLYILKIIIDSLLAADWVDIPCRVWGIKWVRHCKQKCHWPSTERWCALHFWWVLPNWLWLWISVLFCKSYMSR